MKLRELFSLSWLIVNIISASTKPAIKSHWFANNQFEYVILCWAWTDVHLYGLFVKYYKQIFKAKYLGMILNFLKNFLKHASSFYITPTSHHRLAQKLQIFRIHENKCPNTSTKLAFLLTSFIKEMMEIFKTKCNLIMSNFN